MNRNLSDVAAMGGRPLAATLSLVVPRSMTLDQVQEVYLGAEEAGLAAACPIVGGDFASWDSRLVVTVGILGTVDHPVLREGSLPGQTLFVTGALGGSILGRHLTFEPRVGLSRRLAAGGDETAMIDLSDGLSRDLGHVCRASSVGAVIDAAAIPVHGDAVEVSRRDGRPPLDHALHDGEDYELLFTGRPREYPGATRVGVVTDEPGATWLRLADGSRRPLAPEGWGHTL